jgi:NAD(P)-dependent dehydrogenase (short-subunit alcohol dehydrogenase family)
MPASPRVIVVTGASAGVGRAIAHAFARERAKIGLIARSRAALEDAALEVRELGGEALVCPADVADAAQIEAAAAAVEERFGPIDVWVNDAMASVFSPVHEMTAEEFKRVTDVTYLGYVYGTLAALKRMRPRNRGHIIQVGSALAYRGIPLQSAYCAAKHAIQGFCDSLRCELLHYGSNISLTMVQMPALNTPQFRWVKSRLPHKAQPVPPIYSPEVAARAVLYASHHRRREIWVGLPTLKAILANKMFPGLLDHYLARNGFSSQQYDGPEDPNRPHNLWEPVESAHSTHGDFTARERPFSPQLWTNLHRGVLSLAVLALVALGLGSWLGFRELRER